MENSEVPAPVQAPAKNKKPVILIAVVIVVLVVIASVAAYFVVTGQKKEEASVAPATASPQAPSKEDVDQIMSSVDGKIDQATADNTSANAALKDASSPVEVNL